MTTPRTTKFFAVDPAGELIGTACDTYDEAAALCQDAARGDGPEDEGYTVEESGERTIVIVSPNLGECSDEEYDAEMQRLEDAYTAVEGDTRYIVTVRRAHDGEADGTYYRKPDGTLQILGYSIPRPSDLSDLSDLAYAEFCKPRRRT